MSRGGNGRLRLGCAVAEGSDCTDSASESVADVLVPVDTEKWLMSLSLSLLRRCSNWRMLDDDGALDMSGFSWESVTSTIRSELRSKWLGIAKFSCRTSASATPPVSDDEPSSDGRYACVSAADAESDSDSVVVLSVEGPAGEKAPVESVWSRAGLSLLVSLPPVLPLDFVPLVLSFALLRGAAMSPAVEASRRVSAGAESLLLLLGYPLGSAGASGGPPWSDAMGCDLASGCGGEEGVSLWAGGGGGWDGAELLCVLVLLPGLGRSFSESMCLCRRSGEDESRDEPIRRSTLAGRNGK